MAGFTGCYASPIALAATQEAAKYGLPFSIDSGLADSITTRGLKNVFRLFPTATATTTADAMVALDSINKKAGSPAKTGDRGARGWRVRHQSGQAAEYPSSPSINIKLLETIPHATPTRDFTNIVLRIKAAKPDLVIPADYTNEYVLLARTLVQQKVDLVGIYSLAGGGFNLRFAKDQPTVAENIIDFNHWLNPRSPEAPAFRKQFEDKGTLFSYELLFGYFAVRFLLDGVERAGGVDKEKLAAALAASTFGDDLLTYGPTKMVDGQNINAHATAQQIQKGDIDVVFPAAYANATAIFPRPKS